MKNNYSVKITESTYKDLDNIFCYMSEELKKDQAAIEHIEDINKGIQRLKCIPILAAA